MKVRFLFAWFDLWVGVYVDRKSRRVFILPLPMFGVVIDIPRRMSRSEKAACRIIKEAEHLSTVKDCRDMAEYLRALASSRGAGL